MVLEKSDTTLLMEQLVVSSDDDLEIWAGITVGYDDDKNFVIELAFEDYEDNSRNKVTRAVLDKHNTCLLCDRLGTSILKLPETIAERFNDRYPSYVPSQINAAFGEMLDFLLSERVRFTIQEDASDDTSSF